MTEQEIKDIQRKIHTNVREHIVNLVIKKELRFNRVCELFDYSPEFLQNMIDIYEKNGKHALYDFMEEQTGHNT